MISEADLQQKLTIAYTEIDELRGRNTVLEARYDNQDALKAELDGERERRKERLYANSMRRLMQQGLARGFNAWLPFMRSKSIRHACSRRAHGRLTRPVLSGCVAMCGVVPLREGREDDEPS